MDSYNKMSADSTRLFIGIPFSPDPRFIEVVQDIRDNLADENIKWSPVSNFHLTLHFLGTTPNFYQNTIQLLLNNVSKTLKGFQIKIAGIATFGRKNRPGVLWAGCSVSAELSNLYTAVGKELVGLGLIEKIGDYSPHITLGRIRSLRNQEKFYSIKDKYSNEYLQEMDVKRVCLYKSETKPQGSVYTIIGSAKLK